MNDLLIVFLSLVFYAPVAFFLYTFGVKWASEARLDNTKMWGVLAVVFHVIVLAYLFNKKTAVYNEDAIRVANETGEYPMLKRNFLPYILIGVVILVAFARVSYHYG